MASPRKNGMNGDGPDSTVTSSPQTKQRPCRPQARQSGHLLSTARPSGPGHRPGPSEKQPPGPSRVVYNRGNAGPRLAFQTSGGVHVGQAEDARPRGRGRSGGPGAALRRPAIDTGDAPAVGAHAAALAGHDRRGARQHAGLPGVRDPGVARQPLLPGRPVPAGGGGGRARGGRPDRSRRRGRAGRGVLRRGRGAARRLPAARAAVGPARHARDGRGPADGGRDRDQVLHPAPGRRDGLGVRRLDAPRPGRLRGPVPPAPRLHAQPGGDRPSLRQLDRAGGRLEADRRDHEPGPRGDRAQGDRRRARAAAGVDADRDHGGPVPGGGSRPGGRGAGEGAGPRRHDAARDPLGPARHRRRSSCPRRASTPSAPSSPPARASAGSRTAAARRSSAPARERAGGRS